MDSESLTFGAVVASLVAKSVDTAGDRLVSGVTAALGRLRDRLRRRFTDEGDEDALVALEHLEEAPDSPSRLSTLGEAVDRHAYDNTFRAELEALATTAQRTIAETLIQQTNPHNIKSPVIGRVGGDVHLVYEAAVSNKTVCACGLEARVVCTRCQVQFCRRHISEPLEIAQELADLERRYYASQPGGGWADDHLPRREQTVFANVFFRADHDGVVVCRVCRLEAVKRALSKLPSRPALPTGPDPATALAALADPSLLGYYSTQELKEAKKALAGDEKLDP